MVINRNYIIFPEDIMKLKCRKKENNLLVTISGDIDHHSAQDISESIARDFRHSRCKNIIINFSDVSFMDSSGIGMLIGRYKETEIFGGRLAAVSISRELMKIFKVSGLYKIINCYDNENLAMEAFRGE